MFTGIAGRYDLANHMLSMGIDFYWRKRLVSTVRSLTPQTLCDLATGSGDVAFALCDGLPANVEITGLDFCEAMLEQAREKQAKNPRHQKIAFGVGDCLNLPLETDSVDVLTISFGLRNLENRKQGLEEMRRVLKPGGTLVCLEFSQPVKLIKPFYYMYLKGILPFIARIVTGNKSAYEYLGGTIATFPNRQQMEMEMKDAGFAKVSSKGITGTIVAIHSATKA